MQKNKTSTQGYIYILSNPSMNGIFKIGKTTRHPNERMNELHTTGVPTPFVLEFSILVPNCNVTENKIHGLLNFCRVQKNREFFKINIEKALDLFLGEIGDFELDFTTKNFNVESLQNKIRERKAAEQKIIEERQRIYEIQRAAQAKKEEEEDQEIANKAFDVVVEGWITAKVYLDLPDKPPKPSEQLFEDIAPLLNSFFVLILYIIAICLFMVGSVAAKGHIALSVGIIVVGLFLVIFISSKEEDVRKWKNEVSEHIYLEDKMNELHQEFEALLQENHASRERQIKRFNKIISLIKQNTYREESYKKIEAYNKLTGLQLFSNPANITDMMRAFYNEHFFQDQ
jgi:hypothetical protein